MIKALGLAAVLVGGVPAYAYEGSLTCRDPKKAQTMLFEIKKQQACSSSDPEVAGLCASIIGKATLGAAVGAAAAVGATSQWNLIKNLKCGRPKGASLWHKAIFGDEAWASQVCSLQLKNAAMDVLGENDRQLRQHWRALDGQIVAAEKRIKERIAELEGAKAGATRKATMHELVQGAYWDAKGDGPGVLAKGVDRKAIADELNQLHGKAYLSSSTEDRERMAARKALESRVAELKAQGIINDRPPLKRVPVEGKVSALKKMSELINSSEKLSHQQKFELEDEIIKLDPQLKGELRGPNGVLTLIEARSASVQNARALSGAHSRIKASPALSVTELDEIMDGFDTKAPEARGALARVKLATGANLGRHVVVDGFSRASRFAGGTKRFVGALLSVGSKMAMAAPDMMTQASCVSQSAKGKGAEFVSFDGCEIVADKAKMEPFFDLPEDEQLSLLSGDPQLCEALEKLQRQMVPRYQYEASCTTKGVTLKSRDGQERLVLERSDKGVAQMRVHAHRSPDNCTAISLDSDFGVTELERPPRPHDNFRCTWAKGLKPTVYDEKKIEDTLGRNPSAYEFMSPALARAGELRLTLMETSACCQGEPILAEICRGYGIKGDAQGGGPTGASGSSRKGVQ